MKKYYEINEAAAKQSKEMNSFSEYVPGSCTAEYRRCVDFAAEIAERRKTKVSEFYHEKIDRLLDAYARVLADAMNKENEIGCRCPSVFIAGSANFPVRKKEKQVAAWDANRENFKKADHILSEIKSVGTGPVDFADPRAREMLQEKVDKLEKLSDDAKKMNAHWRKNKTMAGFPGIENPERMDAAIRSGFHDAPYPSYELTSIRNRLKAAKERLDRFDALHNMPEDDSTFNGGRIVRNVEQDRLQILFDEKPDEEMRTRLKENGFRWSPKNSAWQRQLTKKAEEAARTALEILTFAEERGTE